jgi:hypothetical protein
MSIDTHTPYWQGVLASYRQECSSKDSPYPWGSDESMEWKRGWWAGQSDLARIAMARIAELEDEIAGLKLKAAGL